MEDRRGKAGVLRALFCPSIVPFVHVSVVACLAVGLQWFPWHAGVEDRQDVMKDCGEGELRLGSFLRSVYMGLKVTGEVCTRDLGRHAMVNERRSGGFGLCIPRPVRPDEGGLCASSTLLSFSLILL